MQKKHFYKKRKEAIQRKKEITLKRYRSQLALLLRRYRTDDESVSPFEVGLLLRKIRDIDSKSYIDASLGIPKELLALVLLELPLTPTEEILEALPNSTISHIVDNLESDDAARIIKDIEKFDSATAKEVIGNISDSSRSALETVLNYAENETGAFMQTEMLEASIDESIASSFLRLKKLKKKQQLHTVYQVFVLDANKKFLGSVKLDDLVTYPSDLHYSNVIEHIGNKLSVSANDPIEKTIELFEKFGIPSVGVVDTHGKLVGRITSDDVYEIIEARNTKQIYNLAMVNEKAEEDENFWRTGKTRALWLGINLLTAIAAALVIGLFDSTIESLVALAVLMPIVASMSGNAGTQTLTVIVRQLALGEIDMDSAKKAVRKEVFLSLLNGGIYAVVMGVIAYFWFNIALLGLVIAVAMVVSLIIAGFFGAVVPIVLKKINIDPAISSTVVLTTVTDIASFFSFLGLATLVLL